MQLHHIFRLFVLAWMHFVLEQFMIVLHFFLPRENLNIFLLLLSVELFLSYKTSFVSVMVSWIYRRTICIVFRHQTKSPVVLINKFLCDFNFFHFCFSLLLLLLINSQYYFLNELLHILQKYPMLFWDVHLNLTVNIAHEYYIYYIFVEWSSPNFVKYLMLF